MNLFFSIIKRSIFLLCLLGCGACKYKKPPQELVSAEISPEQAVPEKKTEKSRTALYFESLGLVDIQQIDASVLVCIKYATTDNFTGKILYSDLHQAYFQPDVAEKIVSAQQILQTTHPHYSLLIYDAARPLYAQQVLWDAVQGTAQSSYVAHPEKTGLHNYGAAVDVTLADSSGFSLDMGTPFDYFGKKASIIYEDSLLNQGLLNQKQIENRRILRQVMRQAGFQTVSGEWWHFNACSLSEAKTRYKLLQP